MTRGSSAAATAPTWRGAWEPAHLLGSSAKNLFRWGGGTPGDRTHRSNRVHFTGKTPTIQEVAAALQVDTVLEGSVRRSGDTIRVVVQLITAHDGTHLWSEKYDRPLTEIFAVQDEIAGQIVKALLPQLGAGEAGLASRDTGRCVHRLTC